MNTQDSANTTDLIPTNILSNILAFILVIFNFHYVNFSFVSNKKNTIIITQIINYCKFQLNDKSYMKNPLQYLG